MPPAMGESELKKRLLEFDRAVSLAFPGRVCGLVLVGGGATALLGCLARPTDDLDALGFETDLVPLMERFNISARVVASKLYSGRGVDAMDVRRPEVLETLDWEVLAEVVEDMADSRLSDRAHEESLATYEAYRKEYAPCDA